MNFVSKHRIFRRALLIGATISLVLTLSSANAQAAETFTWGGATFTYAEKPKKCNPEAAPCDLVLEIENDQGLPMYGAYVSVDDPGQKIGRLNDEIHINFGGASFYLHYSTDGGMNWYKRGPFKYPVPAGIPKPGEDSILTGTSTHTQTFHASESIQPGDQILVTRSTEYDAFPEGEGVPITLSAGRQKVVLPSFGQDLNRTEASVGAKALLGLINDERERLDAQRLKFSPVLNVAAQFYANWVCEHGQVHSDAWHDQNGSPTSRAIDSGWPRGSVAENGSAGGAVYPEESYARWMASPPHKRNMLNPSHEFAGIGHSSECGIVVLKMTSTPKGMNPKDVPVTNNTGDSSLSRLRDRPRDPETRKTRFAPRFILKKARARNPVLTIRTGQAKGRFAVRYRKRVIRGSRKIYRFRVGKRGRITIRYTANNKSRVKSGVAARCLKAKKGRVRLTRC